MGIDGDGESKPVIDALLVIRYLFGFSGASLTSGAVSGDAGEDSSEAIAGYLTDADLELSWISTAMASPSRLQTVFCLYVTCSDYHGIR